MRYYIGYFNKPWDKTQFTVICGCPSKYAAQFILEQYKEKCTLSFDPYVMLSIEETAGITLLLESH